MCSSQAESRFPKTLLSVSLVFKPGKGLYFSTVRPWDWDTQYVVYTAHFPWKIYLQFPSSSASPPKGAGHNLIASLPFLPNSKWIFLIVLVVYESLCQPPSLFSRRIAPHLDVLLMCVGGGELPILYSPKLIFRPLVSGFVFNSVIHEFGSVSSASIFGRSLRRRIGGDCLVEFTSEINCSWVFLYWQVFAY